MVKRQKQKQKQSQTVNIILGSKAKRKKRQPTTAPRPPVSRGFPPSFGGFPQPPPPPTLQPPPQAPQAVRATASVLVPQSTRVREVASELGTAVVTAPTSALLAGLRQAPALASAVTTAGASILTAGIRAIPSLFGMPARPFGPNDGLVPVPLPGEPERYLVPIPARQPAPRLAYPERSVAELQGLDPLVPLPVVIGERRGQPQPPPAPPRLVPSAAAAPSAPEDVFADAEGEQVPQLFPAVEPVVIPSELVVGTTTAGSGLERLPVEIREEPIFSSTRPPSERVESGLRPDGRPDARTKMGRTLAASGLASPPETLFPAVPFTLASLRETVEPSARGGGKSTTAVSGTELAAEVARSQARRKAKQEKEARDLLPPGFAGIQGEPPPIERGGLEKP